MKRAIVTTTINSPTKALKKFAEIAVRDEWRLFIVGDKKTPHKEYEQFCDQYEGVVEYIGPAAQEQISKKLSDLIGWNCIQRRNFGFIRAYEWGAEIIATVDDDNIPYSHWGKNLKVGTDWAVSTFKVDSEVFDPVSPAFEGLWHRGFPLQLLDQRKITRPQLIKRQVLVQADFWDGSPDVDAIARISMDPQVTFNPSMIPLAGNVMGPFNSQNTFLHRDCFPTYFLFPHIGRMDDIFASYYLQAHMPDSVCYAKASVFQERNPHDLVKDLMAELIGYNHALDFVQWAKADAEAAAKPLNEKDWPDYMPAKSIEAFSEYQNVIQRIKTNEDKKAAA